MGIPVFLSISKPFMKAQQDFLVAVESALRNQGLEPLTLGRHNYDMDAPLNAIRRLMLTSCGLLALAFRRLHIVEGVDRPASDMGENFTIRNNEWLTSSYCQIEPAMAHQLGLPILVWRESGVVAEGVLDRGCIGISMPEFDLSASKTPNLTEPEWRQPFQHWAGCVHSVYRRRGIAPKLWE